MNNTNLLVAYSREIVPMISKIKHQAELQKDFVDSDDEAQQHVAAIKEAQDVLKAYLEGHDDYKEITEKKGELEKELKLALKAAASKSEYKPAQLKAFFKARTKDGAVVKVIEIGDVFSALDEVLK